MKAMIRLSSGLLLLLLTACEYEQQLPKGEDLSLATKVNQPTWERQENFIRYAETLDQVLSRKIADRKLVADFTAAFATVFNVRSLQYGKRYCFLLDSLGGVQGLEYYADAERTVRVVRDATTGSLNAELIAKPVMTKISCLRGVIYTTLYDAIKDCGHTDELIAAFSDVFQWDIDFFTDPRVGDEFVMVFEAVYACDPQRPDSLGERIRYGRVLAGQYHAPNNSYTAIYFKGDGKSGGYYDLEGKSFQKTFLKSPLNYRRISSHFSGARRHPILKIVRPHTGIDFAAPAGTPVSSAADGIVIDKGYDAGIGNYLKIQHKNGRYVTLYGHLQAFASGIEKGAAVKQRDVIGYVGATGLATGPHLHYAFYENGRAINPLRIKNVAGDPIAETDRAEFERVKQDLLQRLAAARSLQWENRNGLHYRNGYGVGAIGLPSP